MLDVTFTPVVPYLLSRSLGSPNLTRRYRGGVLELAYPAAGHDAHARVWQTADGTLRARIACVAAEAAHDRLRQLLTIGLDTRPFLRMAESDQLLSPLWRRMRAVRPLMLATPEHALIRAVTGQLIRSSDALRIERGIIWRLGTRTDRGLTLPPGAAALAAAHPARLEREGLSPKRSVILTRAAGRLKLDALAADPPDLAERRVRREPGLGEWSLGVLMIYGYGRHEHGICGDLSLVRLARAMGVESDREIVARYGEWQGLASIWLSHHPAAARRPGGALQAAR
jgi:3-methyladenine DNA glycosylase/8-oxoguanine DNA glycosylase